MGKGVSEGQEEEKNVNRGIMPGWRQRRIEDENQIRLEGEFYLRVKAEDTFWLRMVICFLRQLEGTGGTTREVERREMDDDR